MGPRRFRLGVREMLAIVATSAVGFWAFETARLATDPFARTARALRYGTVEERRHAAGELNSVSGRHSTAEVVDNLVRALDDPDPGVVSIALPDVARLDPDRPEVFPALVRGLARPEPAIRLRTLETVFQMGLRASSLLPNAAPLADDANPAVRLQAVDTLFRLDHDPDRRRTRILRRLTDVSGDVRLAALKLVDLAEPAPVVPLLRDPDIRVATLAVKRSAEGMAERLRRFQLDATDVSVLEGIGDLADRGNLPAALEAQAAVKMLGAPLTRFRFEAIPGRQLQIVARASTQDAEPSSLALPLGAAVALEPGNGWLRQAIERAKRFPPQTRALLARLVERYPVAAESATDGAIRLVWRDLASDELNARLAAAPHLASAAARLDPDRLELLTRRLDDVPPVRLFVAEALPFALSAARRSDRYGDLRDRLIRRIVEKYESETNAEVLRGYVAAFAQCDDRAAEVLPTLNLALERGDLAMTALNTLNRFSALYLANRLNAEALRRTPAALKRLILNDSAEIRHAAATQIQRLSELGEEGADARRAALNHPFDQEVRRLSVSTRPRFGTNSPVPRGALVPTDAAGYARIMNMRGVATRPSAPVGDGTERPSTYERVADPSQVRRPSPKP